MRKIGRYYCFKDFIMSSGEVAFKKGNFYDGMVDSQHGSFKSDITRTMCHGVDMCLIIEHLRQFKFGR